MLGRLYVILDDTYLSPENVKEVAVKVIRGGADVLQLRAERWDTDTIKRVADAVYPIARENGVPFIINDYVGLAVDYDGVHIGSEDAPYDEARRLLGDGKIVGVSCYDSVETALRMQEVGADYVAFSSPYPSPTKPNKGVAPLNVLTEASRVLRIPFYVIGGIDETRAREVVRAGAYGVAVVSAVLKAEDPEEATRRLRDAVYSSA